MDWKEAKREMLITRIESPAIWHPIHNLIEAGDKALEAKDKEIATQKGMRQNLDTEIMELNKEIARLEQRIKELEKDSCAVCFNDGRNQALEEAAKVAENNQCEADGYHACLHNEFIAKEIRALKEKRQ